MSPVTTSRRATFCAPYHIPASLETYTYHKSHILSTSTRTVPRGNTPPTRPGVIAPPNLVIARDYGSCSYLIIWQLIGTRTVALQFSTSAHTIQESHSPHISHLTVEYPCSSGDIDIGLAGCVCRDAIIFTATGTVKG